MESPSDPESARRRKVLFQRFFWFVTGSILSYLLINTPFAWLKKHTQFPVWLISACSYAVSTSLLFVWNYFVNFRTEARKRDALRRYLIAVITMAVVSSTSLSLLETFDQSYGWILVLGVWIHLNVIANQLLWAGPKFALYHKWAFPPPGGAPGEPPAPGSQGRSPAHGAIDAGFE